MAALGWGGFFPAGDTPVKPGRNPKPLPLVRNLALRGTKNPKSPFGLHFCGFFSPSVELKKMDFYMELISRGIKIQVLMDESLKLPPDDPGGGFPTKKIPQTPNPAQLFFWAPQTHKFSTLMIFFPFSSGWSAERSQNWAQWNHQVRGVCAADLPSFGRLLRSRVGFAHKNREFFISIFSHFSSQTQEFFSCLLKPDFAFI